MEKEKLNERLIVLYEFLLSQQKVTSGKDFSEKAGIPYKSVNHVLSKTANRNVQIEWIDPICRTFNIDRSWFFDQDIPKEPIPIKVMRNSSTLDEPNLRDELDKLKNLFIDLYVQNAALIKEISTLRAQNGKKSDEDDQG